MVNRHHGIDWEFVHLCIDDSSRVAFVQVPDQRKGSAVILLETAVPCFTRLGIRIERVTTDNGKQLINASTLILMVIVCLFQCAYIPVTASAHRPSDIPDAVANSVG